MVETVMPKTTRQREKKPAKENPTSAVERLIKQLESEGWIVQRDGVVYINGALGTNLYKEGQVLHVSQEFYPDEEIVEDLWPGQPRQPSSAGR